MATNEQRRAVTRAKLIEAARQHFAAKGYDETHTGEILKHAGVSRGAMYHHFKSKQELFEAVFIAESDKAIAEASDAAGRDASPFNNLIAASLAWLQVVRRAEVASILLEQGPQVLGWQRARSLEAESSLGLMVKGLQAAVAKGEVSVPSIEMAARLINAILAESALTALYDEPAVSVSDQEQAVRQLIEGIRTP
ncbi:MAG: TetR/AcrR family transcriptional regulator [Candidatus Pelagadaptatus aseana]|uniref:TetR/AcrR family transcriptional regulator n=1 Tax=Candidatus Pelagadaptatus aseana TaxID=3120508 RepID=UPI0039B35963